MKYINKYQIISEEFRQYLSEWLLDNEKELLNMYQDKTITGTDVWKYIDNDNRTDEVNKKKLKEILLKEQGYICCYCGQRVEETNSHIEHVRPKKENKHLTYEYYHLLISCDGASENIIHFVKNEQETKENIASFYGVEVEYLEELYVNDTNFEFIKKVYDLDNLKIDDKVWIFKAVKGKQQLHCGVKKDKNDIPLCPLNEFIESYFVYNASDGKIVEKDDFIKKLVNVLGLNDNPLLLDRRKNRIKNSLSALTNLISAAKNKGLDVKQVLLRKKEKLYNIKNNKLEPFCFVEVAVLENRIKAI